jgi:hypothetical protein
MVVKLSGRQQTIITTADQHYIDDITSADIISLK